MLVNSIYVMVGAVSYSYLNHNWKDPGYDFSASIKLCVVQTYSSLLVSVTDTVMAISYFETSVKLVSVRFQK